MRRAAGNTLILTVAVLIGILMTILTFGLWYTQMLGRTPEQKTAIEAAALAAARALSKVVVETDEIGFVSLSDYGPVGKGTAADDGYSLPVIGINTLLATVRLDMIIADKLDDKIMRQMAKNDYQRAMKVKDQLVTVLKSAIEPGAQCKDLDGNPVEVVEEAISAYKSNQVRLQRGGTVAPLTLKIDLGCAKNTSTNTPVPNPTGDGLVNDTQQMFGCYKAYVDVPYNNSSFVFAATSSSVTLIDPKLYEESPGTPYFIPSIVRCQADHQYTIKNSVGVDTQVRIHDMACAQAANNLDPRPSSGALTFSFPDGMVDGLVAPASIFQAANLLTSPVDTLESPLTGDYPQVDLTDTKLYPPLSDDHPKAVDIGRVALYDWIRRAGTNPNVRSLITMLNTPFDQSLGGQGQIHIYEIDKTGKINYSIRGTGIQSTTRTVSHKQWRAVSGIFVHDGANRYFDLIVKDDVHLSGRKLGGQHGGEPLYGQIPASAPLKSTVLSHWDTFLMPPALAKAVVRNGQEIDEHAGDSVYMIPPTGSGKRPTYDKTSAAVDFKFRLHSFK